uniref:Uncharacterized protein n=1 Tax=Siphoviridae sp. ct3R43 TaxID=2825321 RepID=A0A8S5VFU8_9CAUD|nr:MAG TPA: hypothetical protein [Siphoviridae sp. ct3R43]
MTEQTQGNKDRLATIKSAQNALVYDLIMQGFRAATVSKAHFSVWVDAEGDLMVNTDRKRKRSYVRFGDDIQNSDIDDLVDIVEWLLNGAPEEKDEAEDDD